MAGNAFSGVDGNTTRFQFLGHLFNWGLFGALTVQVCTFLFSTGIFCVTKTHRIIRRVLHIIPEGQAAPKSHRHHMLHSRAPPDSFVDARCVQEFRNGLGEYGRLGHGGVALV